jgi:hypothetical protein
VPAHEHVSRLLHAKHESNHHLQGGVLTEGAEAKSPNGSRDSGAGAVWTGAGAAVGALHDKVSEILGKHRSSENIAPINTHARAHRHTHVYIHTYIYIYAKEKTKKDKTTPLNSKTRTFEKCQSRRERLRNRQNHQELAVSRHKSAVKGDDLAREGKRQPGS